MQQALDDSAESTKTAGTELTVSIHYRPERTGKCRQTLRRWLRSETKFIGGRREEKVPVLQSYSYCSSPLKNILLFFEKSYFKTRYYLYFQKGMIMVFWDMISCKFVDSQKGFGGNCCLHLRLLRRLTQQFSPETSVRIH